MTSSSSVWPPPPAAMENKVSSSVWPSLPKKNMASSSVGPSPITAKKERVYTNWVDDLPPDLTSSILLRLGPIEILESAQKVCRTWRNVCKDPLMWRKIDMYNLGNLSSMRYDLRIMCRHAVDRSGGDLNEIALWYFGTDELLNYIAERSSNLRSLRLIMCYPITDEGFVEAVAKLPLLEDLELSYCKLSHESLKVVGQSCPNLKSLILNCDNHGSDWCFSRTTAGHACDEESLAIAETMPRLRRIQLVGNSLSDTGLNAILDNCPKLEYLDLRECSNINFVGDLEKRCSERIRVVRRPDDSSYGYPFDANIRNRDFYDDYSDVEADIPRDYDYPWSDYEYDEYDELYDFIVD